MTEAPFSNEGDDSHEAFHTPRLGTGYRRGPSIADKALARVGENDAWSKSTLRKVAIVSRWRKFKSFLLAMLPASVRIRFEPKPPFND